MDAHQPGSAHFTFSEYVGKPRWASYWHQIDEVSRAGAKTCLLVGVGDGLLATLLRHQGIQVTTVDIVGDLQPDLLADVRALPLEDHSYDAVLCCQVLEHLEYEYFLTAVRELVRVARDIVLISLPDAGRAVDVALRVANKRVFRRIPLPSRKKHYFNGVHHWELGTLTTPTADVVRAMSTVCRVRSSYRVKENVYHHFFVLEPRGTTAELAAR